MQKEKYYLQVIENNSPNNKYEDLQFEHAYNLYDLIFRIGAREGYRHVVNVEQENETTHIITFDNQILKNDVPKDTVKYRIEISFPEEHREASRY